MAGYDYDGMMDGLRNRVQQLIGSNAVTLARHGVGPQTKAPIPPEKQWWNFPAKYHAAERIKAEVLHDYPGWNDAGDAARHAELSRRMASEIDPLTSYAAGVAHEIDNSIPEGFQRFAPPFMRKHAEENWHGQDKAEGLMDLRNNAEGRRAAREGRPIDPAHLQTSPAGSARPGAPYQANRAKPR